ncbi:hypothetical protein [Methylobacterium nigriterrae]|uniref:hypothetical protein n=1 Tax=Methylobacterium nigriterrae TaxID=3127512 RepID=UPI003013E2CC
MPTTLPARRPEGRSDRAILLAILAAGLALMALTLAEPALTDTSAAADPFSEIATY